MCDIYSQGIQDSYDGPYVVIIKNGLPMSDDDVQEDLERMQTEIKQLEADYNNIVPKFDICRATIAYHLDKIKGNGYSSKMPDNDNRDWHEWLIEELQKVLEDKDVW